MPEGNQDNNVVWDITSFEKQQLKVDPDPLQPDTQSLAAQDQPTESMPAIGADLAPEEAINPDVSMNEFNGKGLFADEKQENLSASDQPTQSMPSGEDGVGGLRFYGGGDGGGDLPPEGPGSEEPEPRKNHRTAAVVIPVLALVAAVGGIWAGIARGNDDSAEVLQKSVDTEIIGENATDDLPKYDIEPGQTVISKKPKKSPSAKPSPSDKPTKKPKPSKTPSPTPVVEPEPTPTVSETPEVEASPTPTEAPSPTPTQPGNDDETADKQSQKKCVAGLPMELKVHQKSMFGANEENIEDLTPVFVEFKLGGVALTEEVPADDVKDFEEAQDIAPFIGRVVDFSNRYSTEDYGNEYQEVHGLVSHQNEHWPYSWKNHFSEYEQQKSPRLSYGSYKGVKFAVVDNEQSNELGKTFVEAWQDGADVVVMPKSYEADDLSNQIEEIQEQAMQEIEDGDFNPETIDKSVQKIFKAKKVDACGLSSEADETDSAY